MTPYSLALADHLKGKADTQSDFAARIGAPQATVCRYVNGDRLPTAEYARKIEAATDGQVPFDLWQSTFMERHAA